jgi:lipoprotein-anchoring transpeptidase ErfK/SrfK
MKRPVLSAVLAVVLLAGGVTASVVALRAGGGDEGPGHGSALAAASTGVGPANLPPRAVGPARQPEPGVLGAYSTVADIDLFPSADATRPMWTLPNPTHEGVPLAFTVLDRVGSRLQVRLPIRPNGSVAWVDAHQVSTWVVPNHLVVDLSDRRLTALHGDEVLLEAPVAVGSPSTPTPLGDFYIDISLPNPGGVYGAWMLSVAGFSNVLTSFGGGIGQIAIHGWSDESVFGQAVSNGCIRMSNGVISRLAQLAPVGTPVTVRE